MSTSKDDIVVMTSRETQTKRKAGGINRERARSTVNRMWKIFNRKAELERERKELKTWDATRHKTLEKRWRTSFMKRNGAWGGGLALDAGGLEVASWWIAMNVSNDDVNNIASVWLWGSHDWDRFAEVNHKWSATKPRIRTGHIKEGKLTVVEKLIQWRSEVCRKNVMRNAIIKRNCANIIETIRDGSTQDEKSIHHCCCWSRHAQENAFVVSVTYF